MLETDKLPILVRIAAFHYFFGFIHPFYDGNGRISRFISSYLLKKNAYPLLALDLSHTIKEYRKTYYNAFRECNDKRNKGDITPFIITFLEFLDKSTERMLQNLNEGIIIFERLFDLIKKKLNDSDKQKEKKLKYQFEIGHGGPAEYLPSPLPTALHPPEPSGRSPKQ
jgi:Fic family protein